MKIQHVYCFHSANIVGSVSPTFSRKKKDMTDTSVNKTPARSVFENIVER